MKHICILLVCIMALLAATPALASDISGARYYGTITISNNGTDATEVSTVFTANTSALINAGYLNSSASDVAVVGAAGLDVAFMPGYGTNPWVVYVPSISASTYLTDIGYMSGASGGKIRYFPADAGMDITDDPTLEISDNGTISIAGPVNTDAGAAKNLADKGAVTVFVSPDVSGNITANITGTATWETPSVGLLSESGLGTYNGTQLVDGNTGTNGFETNTAPVGAYLRLDYGAGNYKNLVGWRFYAGNVSLTTVWNIQYSDNATDWTTVYTGLSMDGAQDWHTATWESAGWHRYWQSYLASGNSPNFHTELAVLPNYKAAVTASGISSGEKTVVFQIATPFIGIAVDQGTDLLPTTENLTFNAPLWQQELNGDTFTTIDSNAYACTNNGSSWTSSGRSFDGVDNRISFSEINLGTANTIMLWVYIDALADIEALLGDNTAKNNYLLWYFAGGDDLYYWSGSAGNDYAVFDNIGLTTGWNFFSLARSGQTVSLSINDVSKGNGAVTGTLANTLVDTLMAKTDGTTASEGILGEIVFYTRALDTDDQSAYYDATKSKYTDGDIYIYSTIETIADTSDNWTFCENAVMPYMESANISVGGNLAGSWAWEYNDTFTDLSGNGNTATPTFRTTTSNADVTAALSSFQPVSESQSPGYVLTSTPDFITTTPEASSTFTSGFTSNPTYLGRGVISSIATASQIPEQVPTLVILMSIMMIISLCVSFIMRNNSDMSLLFKAMVLIGIMCIGVAVGVVDVYQIYFFAIFIWGFWLMRRKARVS